MSDKSTAVLKELRQIRGILGKIETAVTRAVSSPPDRQSGDISGVYNDWLAKSLEGLFVDTPKCTKFLATGPLKAVGEDIMDNPTKFTPRQEKWIDETITGLTTRIEELQGSVRRRDTVIKQANEELKDARELIASHGPDRLMEIGRYQREITTHEQDKAARRMENVCRLATAADRHIAKGNYNIARQLLTLLIEGQHDSYPEKENWNEEVFGNSNEARTGQFTTDSSSRKLAEPNEWSITREPAQRDWIGCSLLKPQAE